MVERDLQGRVAAHRQPDKVGLVDFQVIEHRHRITHHMNVAVGFGIDGTSDGL